MLKKSEWPTIVDSAPPTAIDPVRYLRSNIVEGRKQLRNQESKGDEDIEEQTSGQSFYIQLQGIAYNNMSDLARARRYPEFITFDCTCKTNRDNLSYLLLLGMDGSRYELRKLNFACLCDTQAHYRL
jgi:hypothetical protein